MSPSTGKTILPGTYSGDPTTSPKDEVRFLIGDTDPNSFDLSDQEIIYQLLLVWGPVVANWPASGNFLPAAYSADAIAARYKKKVDKSVGDLRISYSSLEKQFEAIAIRLRSRASLNMVPVYAGGISKAVKRAMYQDQDIYGTAVRVDGMDDIFPLNGVNPTDSTGGENAG